jgi:glycosyltransferase involved in cell wall biosynthesis
MKALLLIPSVLKREIAADVTAGHHPRMDYFALADGLRAGGAQVDLLDYECLEQEQGVWVKLVRRLAGRDAGLALLGFLLRHQYDALFTNGENLAIPLAMLLKTTRQRPGHVTIGHRISTGKKQLFFQRFRVQSEIDTLLVYAHTQLAHALGQLRIPPERLSLIPFHADMEFYHPLPTVPVDPDLICAAGLEWRDYPTLIKAVAEMPEVQLKLAAASPWSKHVDETADRTLPPNVQARRYSYHELRELYASSSFVVVPLYENDFQAGVTSLLEAMAMGKAVIVTRTSGQTDVVIEGETGLTVAPGDVIGWRNAIRQLREDGELRDRLGRNARQWVRENATLERWVENVAGALQASAGQSAPATGRAPRPA